MALLGFFFLSSPSAPTQRPEDQPLALFEVANLTTCVRPSSQAAWRPKEKAALQARRSLPTFCRCRQKVGRGPGAEGPWTCDDWSRAGAFPRYNFSFPVFWYNKKGEEKILSSLKNIIVGSNQKILFLFLDPRRLSAHVAQVKELGPLHLSLAHELDVGKERRMQRERPFNVYAARRLAERE